MMPSHCGQASHAHRLPLLVLSSRKIVSANLKPHCSYHFFPSISSISWPKGTSLGPPMLLHFLTLSLARYSRLAWGARLTWLALESAPPPPFWRPAYHRPTRAHMYIMSFFFLKKNILKKALTISAASHTLQILSLAQIYNGAASHAHIKHFHYH